FGFQRTGDFIWAATDQLARGFMIGATAGRTTLAGEGLQHADGHSQLLAASNPGVVSYDPAYGYEIAHIIRDGLRRMYGEDPENVLYYLTVYNEPMQQPAEPDDVDVEGILAGMHLISAGKHPQDSDDGGSAEGGDKRVRLLSSGVGVPWALDAQQLLADDWGVSADVWSVTSWTELRREAMACEEAAFEDPAAERRVPYVTRRLSEGSGPVIATSDWMRQVQDQIAPWVPEDYYALGADGFGFADTRAAARRFFRIDGPCMAVKALQMLADRGELDPQVPLDAAAKYRIDDVTAGTSGTAGGDA
ncbi:MAG: pyruvate dehydrogenase (acetyl-transferring), homodimeric type, partial [Actinobacteria bacterium]|nr:pyruvate dehydrogenase (acetyl-transferring), homodimeric type [Actinomycetota bacterium]